MSVSYPLIHVYQIVKKSLFLSLTLFKVQCTIISNGRQQTGKQHDDHYHQKKTATRIERPVFSVNIINAHMKGS